MPTAFPRNCRIKRSASSWEQPALTFVRKNAGLKILDREFAKEQYAIALSKKKQDFENAD